MMPLHRLITVKLSKYALLRPKFRQTLTNVSLDFKSSFYSGDRKEHHMKKSQILPGAESLGNVYLVHSTTV